MAVLDRTYCRNQELWPRCTFPVTRTTGSGGVIVVCSDIDVEWTGEDKGQVLANRASRQVSVVSWEIVRVADKEYAGLLWVMVSGDPWDVELVEYKRYRVDMTMVDGVALFSGQVVMPSVLRSDVLMGLHCAQKRIFSCHEVASSGNSNVLFCSVLFCPVLFCLSVSSNSKSLYLTISLSIQLRSL